MFGKANCIRLFTIFYFIIILVSIILFGVSFKIVKQNTVGLKRNSFTAAVTFNKLYYPGRYFLGISGRFIAYDINWQYITFGSGGDSTAISSQTNEGIISIEVSLAYRLKEDLIYKLYQNYPSKNHLQIMINQIKSTIQNYMNGQNDTAVFYQQRPTITGDLSRRINVILKDQFFCEMTYFSLGQVTFGQMESKIIQQAIQQKQIDTQRLQNLANEKQAEINNLISDTQRNQSDIMLDQQYLANQMIQNQQILGEKIELISEYEAYQGLYTNLTLTSSSQLVRLKLFDSLIQNSNINLFLGFSSANTNFIA